MNEILEALNCLEGIEDVLWDDDFHYQKHSKLLDTIKQALLEAQREHKTLEVIKKKPCNSGLCINYLKVNKQYPNMQDYEHYCMAIREYDRVNEDEFNLLKEWVLK